MQLFANSSEMFMDDNDSQQVHYLSTNFTVVTFSPRYYYYRLIVEACFFGNFLKHNRIINFTYGQFQSILQEALTLFVSLSHCFLCSKQLISAHLALAISQPPPASGIDILSAAVVGALSVKENLIQVGFKKNFS